MLVMAQLMGASRSQQCLLLRLLQAERDKVREIRYAKIRMW